MKTKAYEVFSSVGNYRPDQDQERKWHVESPTGNIATFKTHVEAQAYADAKNRAADAAKIADEFHTIAQAVTEIAKVLGRNDALNEGVPKSWPLQLSADEFAVECQEISWYYECLAQGRR